MSRRNFDVFWIYYRKDLLKAQKNLYIYLCNSTSRKKNRQTCLVARFPLQIVTVILPSLGIFPVTNAALLSFFFLILVNSFFKTFTSPCFNSRLNVPVNCFEVHFCCYYCFFKIFFKGIFQVPQNYFVLILLENICC